MRTQREVHRNQQNQPRTCSHRRARPHPLRPRSRNERTEKMTPLCAATGVSTTRSTTCNRGTSRRLAALGPSYLSLQRDWQTMMPTTVFCHRSKGTQQKCIITSKTSCEHATADVDDERGHFHRTNHDAKQHGPPSRTDHFCFSLQLGMLSH